MAGITDWIIEDLASIPSEIKFHKIDRTGFQGLKIPLSDSEFSEEFPTEQSSHGRRSVTGHGPAQLLSSEFLKCPPVLSEIFMFNLENGKLMELVCIYLSNAVRSILSWPRDTRVRNKVSL